MKRSNTSLWFIWVIPRLGGVRLGKHNGSGIAVTFQCGSTIKSVNIGLLTKPYHFFHVA